MVLSQQEAKEFFAIWFGMLNYDNERYKLTRLCARRFPGEVRSAELLPIRQKLWENPDVIDDYIQSQ